MWKIVLSDKTMDDTMKDLKAYHEQNIMQVEKDRYSLNSSLAFEFLRNTTKYHCFDKREGSIVSSVRDNDKVVSDPSIVAKLIIAHYKEVHRNPLISEKIEKTQFPSMKSLKKDEILHIMEKMSYDKAIAFDGLSDHMFNIHNRCKNKVLCSECKQKIAIIHNIFSPKYWNSERASIHFKARLIPLNKKFPNIPDVPDYRPIVVMSPIIKALELRMHKKLDNYLTHRLSHW